MPDLGAYLTSINKTKVNLMRGSDDPKAVSDYSAFYVRRLLSYHDDAIFLANEINCIPGLDPQLQYEFLLNVLPTKSRFSKPVKVTPPEHLELVKKFYQYSTEKALAVMHLHTEDDFEKMQKHMSEGGIVKGKGK